MNSNLLLAFFIPLFVMSALWLPIVGYLFHSLAKHHSAKYEAMGRPSLFNSNPAQLFRLLRFLFTREGHSLGDSRISILCNVMRVWFVVTLFGGLVLVWLMVQGVGS
jgi:hypothetical protein